MRLTDVTLSPPTIDGAPVSVWLQAVAASAARRAAAEWRGSSTQLFLLGRAKPEGLGSAPRDFHPPRPEQGQDIARGSWTLAGSTLEVGKGGDPWNVASPSRRFAVELHRFDWLRDLLACGDTAPREALRLVLEWERVFGRWNTFAWDGAVLRRRVVNLACHLRRLSVGASEVERNLLARSLARQARYLSSLWGGLSHAAECAAAVGAAGAALVGTVGERLSARAIARLQHVLPATVLPDGGHASRAPEAALRLLFDLMTFDDALLQLGRESPPELSRAIDRLTGALRFFTLPDGRLACFQGGEECRPAEIDAARAHDDSRGPPSLHAPHSGYEKLIGRALHAIVDAAPPVTGPWSETACAHPLALEVVVGRDRLITNTGWSPRVSGAEALRLTAGGSTASLADGSAGAPLRRSLARALGPRLLGGAETVDVRRHETAEGVWLELSHDGWAQALGLTHERRLFLDAGADDLRGEDRFVPLGTGADRTLTFIVRFHLHPSVRASLALDQRSVLIQGPTAGGWWLRNDAQNVAVEPSVHMLDGRGRRSAQVVLRSQIRRQRGGRIRWKLGRVESDQP